MKSKEPCKKIAGKSSPKVDMGMSSATDWIRKAREGKGMKNRTGMGVYGEQGRRQAGGHHEGEITKTFAGGSEWKGKPFPRQGGINLTARRKRSG